MVVIKEAVVVEGRYDTARLSAVVDTVIVQTNGFRMFHDPAQRTMLRRLAAERGLIVLTDSDAAGFVIRDRIASFIPPAQIKHAYIPPIAGKERRKALPSKEGLLGVEAMGDDVLLSALRAAGATVVGEHTARPAAYVTPARLMEDGLTGCPDSHRKREALCDRLGLPRYLSTARLIAVLNAAVSEEDYRNIVDIL